MAVDPEWLRKLQEQALAGAQQNPTGFNPEMLAANASMPNPNMGGGLGGLLRRGAIGFQNGLGRFQQAMFPIDSASAAGMSAEDIKNARNQAMLRMGLGMMSSANQGARGGEALAAGFGLAQGGMTDDLQRRMANERVMRQEQRQTERDAIGDERYAEQFAYQQEQDRVRQEMERQQQEESRRRFEANLDLDKAGLGLRARSLAFDMSKPQNSGLGKPPVGYQWAIGEEGTPRLSPIPGGPADPATDKGKITDTQRQAAAYAQRMESAAEKIDTIGYVPSSMDLSLFTRMVGEPGFTQSMANKMLSEDAQKYFQALQDFSRAKLRKESGAVISKEEIFGDLATFFPLPGDSEDVIEQKKAARETVLEGMRTTAGSAMPPRKPKGPPPAPDEAVEFLKQNPQLKEEFRRKYGYIPDGI